MAVLYSIRNRFSSFLTNVDGENDDPNRFRVPRLNAGYGLESLMPLVRNSHVVLPHVIFPLRPSFFLWNRVRGLYPRHITIIISHAQPFVPDRDAPPRLTYFCSKICQNVVPRNGNSNSPFTRSSSGNNPYLFHSHQPFLSFSQRPSILHPFNGTSYTAYTCARHQ